MQLNLVSIVREKDAWTAAGVALPKFDIAAMRAEIRAVSSHMMEFSFRYTVNREAELDLQNHQELIDGLIAKLSARLEKQ